MTVSNAIMSRIRSGHLLVTPPPRYRYRNSLRRQLARGEEKADKQALADADAGRLQRAGLQHRDARSGGAGVHLGADLLGRRVVEELVHNLGAKGLDDCGRVRGDA